MKCIECSNSKTKKIKDKIICMNCDAEFTEEEARMQLGKKSKTKQKFTGRREY